MSDFSYLFFNVIGDSGLKQIIAISPLLLQLLSYTVAFMKRVSFKMLLVFMTCASVGRPFQT